MTAVTATEVTKAFAELGKTLEDQGYNQTETNSYSTTYAKWNTHDKGWTEIILDNEYREVIKDVYAADNRRTTRTSAELKVMPAVMRLIGQ